MGVINFCLYELVVRWRYLLCYIVYLLFFITFAGFIIIFILSNQQKRVTHEILQECFALSFIFTNN